MSIYRINLNEIWPSLFNISFSCGFHSKTQKEYYSIVDLILVQMQLFTTRWLETEACLFKLAL